MEQFIDRVKSFLSSETCIWAAVILTFSGLLVFTFGTNFTPKNNIKSFSPIKSSVVSVCVNKQGYLEECIEFSYPSDIIIEDLDIEFDVQGSKKLIILRK